MFIFMNSGRKGLGLVEVVLATGVLALAAVCVLTILAPAIRASERVCAHQHALDAVHALRQCVGDLPGNIVYYDAASGVLLPSGGPRALRVECISDREDGVAQGHCRVAVSLGDTLLYETRIFL